jgi:hypothetical protein
MIEERYTIHTLLTHIHNPTQRTPVLAFRPLLKQIPNIHDQNIFFRGNWDPGVGAWVEDLKAVVIGLLEQDGDAAEVGVRAS